MDMKTYVSEALKTESGIRDDRDSRLLHGAMGCVTEAGELIDALKKHIYYGRDLDEVNLKEEMGDMLWYMAILCDVLGTSFDELTDMNIAKLRKRYPEKFTSDKAINRDLGTERDELEKYA